jgi:hypothetical protein
MKYFFKFTVAVPFMLFLALFAPAYAQSVSVSIQSLTPGTTLSAGTTVKFQVIAAGFTNPTYTLSDSFGGTTISNSDINSNGFFTWTPQSSDQGVHNVTVSVSDTNGHVATIQVSFTIASAYITLGAVSPSTSVPSGTTVNFSTSVTGFNSPSFAVSDKFNGTTVSSSDINSGGFFTWTPSAGDAGTHDITVLAFDSSGHSASASTEISVSAGTNVSITDLTPGTSVAPGSLVTFEASANNFSNPNFTVTDSFSGTTLTSGDISSSGDFSWTPQTSDIGTHNVNVTAYDTTGHTGSAQTTITVNQNGVVTSTPVTTTTPVVTTTPAAPAYVFTEYLTPGSQDNEVLMLQEILQREGYLTAPPTGYFGTATEGAVEEFQTAEGIDALGVVGPSTRAALNQIEQSLAGTTTTTPSTTTTTTTSNAAVSAQLQSELTTVEQLLSQIQAEIAKMQTGQ